MRPLGVHGGGSGVGRTRREGNGSRPRPGGTAGRACHRVGHARPGQPNRHIASRLFHPKTPSRFHAAPHWGGLEWPRPRRARAGLRGCYAGLCFTRGEGSGAGAAPRHASGPSGRGASPQQRCRARGGHDAPKKSPLSCPPEPRSQPGPRPCRGALPAPAAPRGLRPSPLSGGRQRSGAAVAAIGRGAAAAAAGHN